MTVNHAKLVAEATVSEQRPTRVIVCGEFSSGKSTVLNILMRDTLIPAITGKGPRPVVKISGGDKPGIATEAAGAAPRPHATMPLARDLAEAASVSATLPADQLRGFEFTELPYLEDGPIAEDVRHHIENADILIWATIGSQAWRLSEKTIIASIKEIRPLPTILAVSRADKYRSERDQDRVRERLEREAEDYVDGIVFLHGSRKQITKAKDSEEEWQVAGGPQLWSALAGLDLIGATPDHAAKTAPASEGPTVVPFDPPEAPVEAVDQTEGAATAAGETADGPEWQAELRALTESLNGVVSAGVVPAGDADNPIGLAGSADDVTAAAQACLDCVSVHKTAFDFDGVETTLGRTQITTKNHLLVFEACDDGSVIFMFNRTAKMNPGIALRAFGRLQATYQAACD
ncbi:MAG: dynamin family protein [Albidovulum sp.]|uniref:dynamin family protein n=1 Tax=Albidovulum sp. TaxID=1872424 RepID=UPI003C86C3E7